MHEYLSRLCDGIRAHQDTLLPIVLNVSFRNVLDFAVFDAVGSREDQIFLDGRAAAGSILVAVEEQDVAAVRVLWRQFATNDTAAVRFWSRCRERVRECVKQGCVAVPCRIIVSGGKAH